MAEQIQYPKRIKIMSIINHHLNLAIAAETQDSSHHQVQTSTVSNCSQLAASLLSNLKTSAIMCSVNEFILLKFLGKTIGKGTFGKVKLGNHNLTGEKVRRTALRNLGCCQNSRKGQNSGC
jgi:ribosomal protein L3